MLNFKNKLNSYLCFRDDCSDVCLQLERECAVFQSDCESISRVLLQCMFTDYFFKS